MTSNADSALDTGSGACLTGGACTLREAVYAVNNYAGPNSISFAANVTGTLTLAAALPTVDTATDIAGPGAKVLTISGADQYPVFAVDGLPYSATVSCSDLTIAHGAGTNGAGIDNEHATVTVTDCVFSHNAATADGGAIYSNGQAPLAATLTVTGCAFDTNSAQFGGGIANDGTNANGNATVSLVNCTFSGNAASGTGGGGSALDTDGENSGTATATVSNCTIVNGTSGGGIRLYAATSGTATLNIDNTILAGNLQTGTSDNFVVGSATPTSKGYNLSDDNGGGFLTGTGDLTNTNPGLDPAGLKDNGGPTPTIALVGGSPAIDAGNSNLTTDQRGFKRPYDIPTVANASNGADIGAFELQQSEAAVYYQSGPNFVVTKTADTNDNDCGPTDCSLREAITAANNYNNASGNPGTAITFAPNVTGTITTTGFLPDLDTNITITGPGATVLTLDGNKNDHGFFYVGSGATVSISGLTLANGGNEGGGAIFNQGTTTVSNCVFSKNQAGGGGAIYNEGFSNLKVLNTTNQNQVANVQAAIAVNGGGGTTSLTLNNCAFTGNQADEGGAILNDGDDNTANLTVNNCAFTGNSIFANSEFSGGGAIYNAADGGTATLNLNFSTLTGNSAQYGGALINDGGDDDGDGGTATVNVSNSTLAGNTAQLGGALCNYADVGTISAVISNSTLAGNTAQLGGALFNNGGNSGNSKNGAASLTVGSCTFSANTGTTSGASIYNTPFYSTFGFNFGGTTATVSVGNSILSDPKSAGVSVVNGTGGSFTSLGYNITSDSGSGLLTGTGDLTNTDPKLDPAGLQDNGGPTQTIALQSGSPALNAGDPTVVGSATSYDQRGPGFPRVVGGRLDIGAFEAALSDVSISLSASPATPLAGTSFTYALTVTNNGPGAAQNVTFSEALPTGATFVSVTPASGANFTVTPPAVGSSGGTLSGHHTHVRPEHDGHLHHYPETGQRRGGGHCPDQHGHH